MLTNRQELEWRYTTSLAVGWGAWRRLARARLGELGYSALTASTISVVARMRNGVRQGALGEETGIQGPALVRVINQLVRDRLLRRQEDPADRRGKLLFLTPAGRRLAARIHRTLAPLRSDLLAGASDADLKNALRLAGRFEKASTPMPAPASSIATPRPRGKQAR